jgi:HEAT repeat protein
MIRSTWTWIAAVALGGMLTVATGCVDRGALMAKEPPRPKSAPAVPAAVKQPLDEALRASAREQIEGAIDSADPILRANGIEAAQEALGAEESDRIVAALRDASPLVRFAAAMSAGRLRLRPAYQHLLEMIDDPDASVRVGVRFALHRLGDTRFSHDLEKYARDPDRTVRANTAVALGLTGEKSALNVLRAMTTDRESMVRIQVAEAMWQLGDENGLTTLVESTVSRAPDDQIVATLAIARPRDQRVSEHVRGMLVSDYPEVSLVAARGLGWLDSDEGYTIAMNATKSPDARQKALAALALGAIGRSDAQTALGQLLQDPDPNVRLAAATGILELKPSVPPAGKT